MLEHQKKAKEYTLKKIFRECLKQKEFTCITLQKSLGISKPTINEVLIHLQNNEFISEEGLTQGDIGRKARKFTITPNTWFSLALEIDISKIRIAVVNLQGNFFSLKEFNDIYLTTENFVSRIAELIKDYLKTNTYNIRSCSIAIPGTVSFDKKTITYAPNMNLSNININRLEQYINLPVILENEANCGALAEFYFTEQIEQTSLYISISDLGVGGGYIVDGSLQKGAHRRGGEIGHLSLVIDGEHCSCGNQGCFERYTSNHALLDLLSKKGFLYDSLHDALGDMNNEEIIKQYCHYLGKGIRSLIAILDPHQIIIGGEIAKYKNRIDKYIEQEVFTNNHFSTSDMIKIRYARNQELTSLIGAGLLAYFPYIFENSVYQ